MRPHFGEELWDDFVEHANQHYRAGWLSAFAPETGVLHCVGTLADGAPCRHGATVDLRGCGREASRLVETGTSAGERGEKRVYAAASEALERLHLDHERPLHLTCRWWREQLPAVPGAWDDGLDGAALCHDLFGVCASDTCGAARVRFRCSPPRDASGARLQFVDHAYCHRG